MVSEYRAPTAHNDEPTVFRFLIPSSELGNDGFGREKPSQILDPAAFLRYADVLARSVPGSPDGLNDDEIKVGAYRLNRAAACVDEVLKFLPGTSDELSESAFVTNESRQYWSVDPRRFHRLRLQAVASTYRKIATAFETSRK